MMALRESFHFVSASAFVFTIYYDLCRLNFPDAIKARHDSSGGRLKYLTFWNLLLQAFFFTLSFVNDLIGTRERDVSKRGNLQRFLDATFASLCFPVSIFVCLSFWTLFLVDREMVFPLMFDAFFPKWLNHLMHTMIFPTAVIEMVAIHHAYSCRRRNLFVISLFTAVYITWTFVVAYLFRFWTYPILEMLNIWQRAVFFVVCVALLSSFYFVGEYVHRLKWGPAVSWEKQSKSKKKKKSN